MLRTYRVNRDMKSGDDGDIDRGDEKGRPSKTSKAALSQRIDESLPTRCRSKNGGGDLRIRDKSRRQSVPAVAAPQQFLTHKLI